MDLLSEHDHRSESIAQYVWVDRIGYLRIRRVIRAAIITYVLLTGIVTILTSDILTLLFLGVFATLALAVFSTDRFISEDRRVRVYTKDGFYIAEHVETGVYRQGKTLSEALGNLDVF